MLSTSEPTPRTQRRMRSYGVFLGVLCVDSAVKP
jgi:hypothetical protein